jgi:hypothetical protein
MFRSYDHLQADIFSRIYSTDNGSVVTSEHVITPPEAETHHSTAKEEKYTPIGTKTAVDVTPQNKKIANRPTARN